LLCRDGGATISTETASAFTTSGHSQTTPSSQDVPRPHLHVVEAIGVQVPECELAGGVLEGAAHAGAAPLDGRPLLVRRGTDVHQAVQQLQRQRVRCVSQKLLLPFAAIRFSICKSSACAARWPAPPRPPRDGRSPGNTAADKGEGGDGVLQESSLASSRRRAFS
jgi:hypothetical protein